MATIYLIRHGQASASQVNYDKLSELGVAQAKTLAPYLSDKLGKPDRIERGTLKRHKQTAHYAADHFDVEPCSQRGWNEYDYQAILAAYEPSLTDPDAIKRYFVKNQLPKSHFRTLFLNAMDKWINTKERDPAYPETWSEFTERVLSSFQQLTNDLEGKSALVFTSGGPISLVSCHLLGLPLESFMQINWNLVNGGISKVLLNSNTKATTLSSLNEHSLFEQVDNRHLLTYT